MLLDSNIIIYASRSENTQIRQFIGEHDIVVSAISYVEVLGYHRLTKDAWCDRLLLCTCGSVPKLGLCTSLLSQCNKAEGRREETLYIQLFAFFQVVGYFCQAALEAQSLMINVLSYVWEFKPCLSLS